MRIVKMLSILLMTATVLLSGCSGESTPSAPPSLFDDDTTTAAVEEEVVEETVAYALTDGTMVDVHPSKPLPEPVLAEIKAAILASPHPDYASTVEYMKVRDILEDASKRTGKTVVVFAPITGMLKDDWTSVDSYPVWGLSGYNIPDTSLVTGIDREISLAAAEQFVAGQPESETWELIVIGFLTE